MGLVFTRHARKRILERDIRVDEPHGALEAPALVENYEPAPEHFEPGFARRRPKA